MAIMTVPAEWEPIGNAVFSTVSSAIELTDTPDSGIAMPVSADTAIIYISTKGVHISYDTGTATTGDALYPASNFIVMENNRTALVGFSAVESAASARIDVWYFNVSGRGRTN